jgi:DNA-directed RNA polymerase subunit RPC12/RpoP
MGTLLKGECGYETDNLLLGGGMHSFKTYFGFPYFCNSCRSLFVGNYLNKEQLCPECLSKETVIYSGDSLCHSTGKDIFNWRIDDKKILTLTEGDYFCTNCSTFELHFGKRGAWD